MKRVYGGLDRGDLGSLRADAGAAGDDYTVALVDRVEGCKEDEDFFRDGLSARIGEGLAWEILDLSPEEAFRRLEECFGLYSNGKWIADDGCVWEPDEGLRGEIARVSEEERPKALLDAYEKDGGARGVWLPV